MLAGATPGFGALVFAALTGRAAATVAADVHGLPEAGESMVACGTEAEAEAEKRPGGEREPQPCRREDSEGFSGGDRDQVRAGGARLTAGGLLQPAGRFRGGCLLPVSDDSLTAPHRAALPRGFRAGGSCMSRDLGLF